MNKSGIKNILVVCTGNSCRSVMAEGYLKKRLRELGRDINVSSAGTATFYGMSASPETVAVMKANGVDVSSHEATPISRDNVSKADIILVMSSRHKDMVLSVCPGKEKNVYYLRSFEGSSLENEIPDPIGYGSEVYTEVFGVIKRSTEGFLKWLEEK